MKTETVMKLWMGALIGSVVVGVIYNIVLELIA